jgi:hypothetical protein
MALKNIICIKWGTAYGAKDVNILYAMVARHITGDFRVFCFTDDTSGIRPEVNCMPLPPLGCEIPPDVPGKWPKIALWGKDLFGLEGVALFIDLDSIIVDNINCYFDYGKPSDVITARNWLNILGKSAQTSVFRFPIGQHSYMLENLQADPANISRKFQYEQNYVTHNVRGGVKFWPESWTKHFRVHCMGSLLFRYLRRPIIPKGSKIITFPGLPGPANAMQGRWIEGAESRPPGQQLKWVWQRLITGKTWKHELSRYVRKADWIADHWRE